MKPEKEPTDSCIKSLKSLNKDFRDWSMYSSWWEESCLQLGKVYDVNQRIFRMGSYVSNEDGRFIKDYKEYPTITVGLVHITYYITKCLKLSKEVSHPYACLARQCEDCH